MILSNMNTVLVLIMLSLMHIKGFDYCSVTCRGQSHTMCLYPEGGGGECRGYRGGLSAEEQGMILRIHNVLRQKVALGREYPLPSAANMIQLTWDDELAAIAQRWMDQCTLGPHDLCRETGDRVYVGQNVVNASFPGFSRTYVIKELLVSFYNEEKDVPPSLVDDFNPEGLPLITHYTQLVWASTSHVGCGLSANHDLSSVRLGCNYKPGGNVLTTPIYLRGEPCSACPRGSMCSPEYPGLCGNTRGYFIQRKVNFN